MTPPEHARGFLGGTGRAITGRDHALRSSYRSHDERSFIRFGAEQSSTRANAQPPLLPTLVSYL